MKLSCDNCMYMHIVYVNVCLFIPTVYTCAIPL